MKARYLLFQIGSLVPVTYFSYSISIMVVGYIGYGAYVMNSEGRLGKKKSKKLSKKDKVKGGSIFE